MAISVHGMAIAAPPKQSRFQLEPGCFAASLGVSYGFWGIRQQRAEPENA